MLKIGCCGWGYLRVKDFFGEERTNKFKSTLQAYAALFPSVEINSTFYRIPKLSTAEKWRKEVDEIRKDFEFTVKCNQLITHTIRFTKASVKTFKIMEKICKKLGARVLLFQSPASFKPTDENVERMREFFENIDRKNLVLVWECRGEWLKKPKLVKKTCRQFELVHCVDPFRNEPVYFGKNKIAYFRLHGFGLVSMYRYNFNREELMELKGKCKKMKKIKDIYCFFNNTNCYLNALQFLEIVEKN
ncbi:MAG: DUF72 domain-containing protein [Candidatus Heimdallarchaeota archaeon]